MILMWACFALLTLIALAFIMLPFFKKRARANHYSQC
jgi:cytochrome c-type biogenesis protein CcmH/NrfG